MHVYIEDPFSATKGQLHDRGTSPVLPQSGLSDKAIDYVMSMQPAFDDLRDAVSQLGALLLLAATGKKAVGDHPMVAVATEACRRAHDRVWRAPSCSDAAEHVRHMKHAVALTREVADMLSISGTPTLNIDLANSKLKCGYRHLYAASLDMTGFELIDPGQACCAEHSR